MMIALSLHFPVIVIKVGGVIFAELGGMKNVGSVTHVMLLLSIIMFTLFLHVFFVHHRKLNAALIAYPK